MALSVERGVAVRRPASSLTGSAVLYGALPVRQCTELTSAHLPCSLAVPCPQGADVLPQVRYCGCKSDA